MKYDPILHVVLHQPEIPENTGNIGRTCVALGAKLWLVRPLGFQVDDRHLKRAGLDYWPFLEWGVVDDWAEVEQLLPASSRYFVTKYGSRIYSDVQYEVGDVLVFGCETRGLPRSLWEATPERALRVPTRDQVRSLNLANTVALVAYEACRQFRHDGRVAID